MQTAFEIYKEIVKENVRYDLLKQDMSYDYDRLDISFLKQSAPEEKQSVSPGTIIPPSL